MGGTERTIKNNITRHQAMQFNAPIGTDLWKDLDQLEIRDNQAEDRVQQQKELDGKNRVNDKSASIN